MVGVDHWLERNSPDAMNALGFGIFLTAFTQYDSLTTKSSFSHGNKIPTT